MKAKEMEKIGKEVRMRFLECHRQRMGKRIGEVGYGHIKSGDRVAHRGRPLADAWLYQEHQRSDPDVYEDLYGISPAKMQEWRDIPGMVEISGFPDFAPRYRARGRSQIDFGLFLICFLHLLKRIPLRQGSVKHS